MDAFGGGGGGGGGGTAGGLMKEGIVIWLVGGGRVINHRITCQFYRVPLFPNFSMVSLFRIIFHSPTTDRQLEYHLNIQGEFFGGDLLVNNG